MITRRISRKNASDFSVKGFAYAVRRERCEVSNGDGGGGGGGDRDENSWNRETGGRGRGVETRDDGGFGCRSAAPAASLEMEAIGIN